MRWVVVSFVAVALAGCTIRDRDDAIDQGAAVGKRIVNASVTTVSEGWRRASEEARRLTPESGRAALQSAERGLEDAKEKLQPGKRLDEAEAEIAKLRAALDIDRLRHEMNDRVDQARKLEANANKSVQDVRDELDTVDRDYKDLQAKLSSAQQAYESAAKRVDAAVRSLN